MRLSPLHLCVLAVAIAALPVNAQVKQTSSAPPKAGVVKRAAPAPAPPSSASSPSATQTTAFTYQGKLSDSGSPASGSYDLQFTLWDANTGGTQQPQPSPVTVTLPSVAVTNGVFTVQLDFGAAAFPGADRFLEISVKGPSDSGYTTLAPRQQVTSTPYAIRSISAASADAATNFSGSLSGDVTGVQSATVVSSVGGQSATNVAAATTAINTATSANTADTLVKRDASGDFSAGTITANLSGNASTATTASGVSSSAGDSVVTAINAGSASITTAHVTGDVELAPSAQQTTSSTNALIDLKLTGSATLGTPDQNPLLRLSASGTFNDGNTHDQEYFRVDNNGNVIAFGNYDSGASGSIPAQGAGTRFFWYGAKAAIRAGGIDGTQWDDANVGLYSVAFGENVRALGDNAIAIGKSSVAAGSRTIAMGEGDTATGFASVALGYGASTSTSAGSPRAGTFVFSDFSVPLVYSFGSSVDTSTQFHPSVTNSFNVRAVNGSFFYTNTALTTGFIFNSSTATMTLANSKLSMNSDGSTTLYSNSSLTSGVVLPAGGGAWSSVSDRNAKENFLPVNPRDILRKVVGLPVSTWNYKTQDRSIRHIGAMAQDFFAAFNVGEDDKHIATIDPDGVALAAIQGLNEELKDRDAKIGEQEKELQEQKQRLIEAEGQLRRQQGAIDALKKLVCAQNPGADICK